MKRKAGESLTEVPVSAKRRHNLSDNSDEELRRLFKHAESNRMHYHNKISLENDEQRQARLAKIRDNYQKRKASQTDEQTQAKLAKRKDNYQKRKASETDEQTQAKLAKRKDSYQRRKASETDEQTQAKLAKRKDNYQKRKASDTDQQTQAKLAKRKDNYQKRKASETDRQRQAKLAKRRDSYQRKKDSNNMQTITVQAPCSSSELDCISSTNTTDKNQYLREFDARKNGEIHMQDWAKLNISRFHESMKYTTLQCTTCKEAWPLKVTKRSPNKSVCLRCSRDKKCPKRF